MPLRVSWVPPDFDMTTHKSFAKLPVQAGQHLVHAVRVGVIEEMEGHFVRGGLAEGVGHELRPQSRAADADDQQILKRPPRAANRAGMNLPARNP